jgi:MerR family transcriptional regulator, light-induced transcriptional regulator
VFEAQLMDQVWSDSDCAERVAGAIQDLSRTLGAAVDARDVPALTGPAQDLERHLVQGAFGDALALCQGLAKDRQAALFLTVIRHLEGRWQTDCIGFADLAFAFYQLRHLIDHAAPALANPPAALMALSGAQDLRILVALAHGETHSFGAQILAGELAARGWSVTQDLTGDGDRLAARLAEERFDVLALSVGHDGALAGLADRIADLRARSCRGGISIMLGGAALAEPRAQYTFLGADAVALSAAEAIAWISTRPAARRPHHRN